MNFGAVLAPKMALTGKVEMTMETRSTGCSQAAPWLLPGCALAAPRLLLGTHLS